MDKSQIKLSFKIEKLQLYRKYLNILKFESEGILVTILIRL